MSKKIILFPFNDENELLSYEGHNNKAEKTIAEARWTGTLTYLEYSRGRSSALLVFTDSVTVGPEHHRRPRRFPFFMSKADEIIPLLVNGKITGTFVPVKIGSNYGWALDGT